MDITRITPARLAKIGPALALSLALTLSLAGCSGGAEEETGGSADQSPRTSQEATETTEATEAMEATSGAGSTAGAPETASDATTEASTPEDSEDPGGSAGLTALSGGVEAARSEAESWNSDAELYGIASVPAKVDAEGENSGWLYSFVSESEGSVISVPYSEGQVRSAQGQDLPRGQIRRIAGDTLTTGELVDSPEAMRRSDEVRSYLEENPEAEASAGLDSGSSDEPEWILTVTAGDPVQERIPATE